MKSLIAALLLIPAAASAGEALVEAAEARQTNGLWQFSVTLSHADTGWEHYADAWAVETGAGEQLGVRELLHPHVNEQPFTRALSGVTVPAGETQVYIRARDSVHGWSADRFEVALPD